MGSPIQWMDSRISNEYFNTIKPEAKWFHSLERYSVDDGSSEDQENKVNINQRWLLRQIFPINSPGVQKNGRVIKRQIGDTWEKLKIELPCELRLKPRFTTETPIESPSFLNWVEITKFGNYNVPHKILLVKKHSDSYWGPLGNAPKMFCNMNNFENSNEDICRKTAYFGK